MSGIHTCMPWLVVVVVVTRMVESNNNIEILIPGSYLLCLKSDQNFDAIKLGLLVFVLLFFTLACMMIN